jgi:hypothetical protein
MEKLRSTDQIKKSLAQLADSGDGSDTGPGDGEGTLERELGGDCGEDNGLPDNLQESEGGGEDGGAPDSLQDNASVSAAMDTS